MNAPTDIKALLTAGQQGKELIHESAHLHVTGEADYTDDIPEHRGTVYAAIIKSPRGARRVNRRGCGSRGDFGDARGDCGVYCERYSWRKQLRPDHS